MAKVNIDVKVVYSVGLEFDTEDSNLLGALRSLERNTLEPDNIDSPEQEVVVDFIQSLLRSGPPTSEEFEIEQLLVDDKEIF